MISQSNGDKTSICQEAWRRVLGISKGTHNKAYKTFRDGLVGVIDHRGGGHARCVDGFRLTTVPYWRTMAACLTILVLLFI